MWSSLANSNTFLAFATSMSIQWVGWAISAYFHTEKFFDLTGSATFLLVSHLSYSWGTQTTRGTVQSWLVTAWAVRLGTFLFFRVMKDGGDKRFDKARNDPKVLLVYWTLQGVWVFVTLLPTIMMNNSGVARERLCRRDYIGWAVWGIGFAFELIADYQKSTFRSISANKGKFIQTGVWSISRHPNYFGEILLWFGLYISSSSVFSGWQYLAVLSPTAVWLLITKISGIPLLEKAGLAKWGNLPEYQKYLLETPILVPFLK